MRKPVVGVVVVVLACGGKREPPEATPPPPTPSAAVAATAQIVHEEPSATGEARMFSAVVSDLDADGKPELIAAGFRDEADGRHSELTIYSERGGTWALVTRTAWGKPGSTIRNVEVADLDGDGREEIVGYGRVGGDSFARARLVVFDMKDGVAAIRAEHEWQHGEYTHGYGLDLGDLDGDGTPEIVTAGFQSDGKVETGFVRVWTLTPRGLASLAEISLDGQGSSAMRVNGVAVGDVDGDHRLEIVVAGRRGARKSDGSKGRRDLRRESGDLTVLAMTGGALAVRARYAWQKGATTRLRSVAVADLDGDHAAEIVVGGQFDQQGKPCLGVFTVVNDALVLRDDATVADASAGEIKDVVIDGEGPDARVITTGPAGRKPARQGTVASWRMRGGKLVRDAELMSKHGDETRARAAVVVAGAHGPMVITVGHALKHRAVIGQILSWRLP